MKRTPPSIKKRKATFFALPAMVFGLLSFYYSNAPEIAIPPVTECGQSLSYDVTIRRYFVLPETSEVNQLTTLEKLQVQPKVERKRVENCVDENGALTTKIYLLNPEEVLAEWMPMLNKTVVSRDSVKMYDQEENLIFERSRSSVLSVLHDSIEMDVAINGLGIPLTFNELVTNETQKLQEEGFNVVTLPDGTILASEENVEIRYFPATYSVERRYFEASSLKSLEKRQFGENLEDELVPVFHRFENYITFPTSGVCVTEIRVHLFSNYLRTGYPREHLRILPGNKFETPAITFSEHFAKKTRSGYGKLMLMPNPVKGELQIKLPVSGTNDYTFLRILDTYGRKTAEYLNLPAGTLLRVNVDEMSPGIYFIQAENGGEFYTERFVKQ